MRAWWWGLRAALAELVAELHALYCLERKLGRGLTAQESADTVAAVRARRQPAGR